VIVRTRAVGDEAEFKCDTKQGRPPELDDEWITAHSADALDASVGEIRLRDENADCARFDAPRLDVKLSDEEGLRVLAATRGVQ
jgi:hypothetical protein